MVFQRCMALAAFPSEKFKNDFGDALLEYAQGGKTWMKL